MKYTNGILQTHTHTWSYPGVVTQIELISDELHLTLDLVKGSVSGQVDEMKVFLNQRMMHYTVLSWKHLQGR